MPSNNQLPFPPVTNRPPDIGPQPPSTTTYAHYPPSALPAYGSSPPFPRSLNLNAHPHPLSWSASSQPSPAGHVPPSASTSALPVTTSSHNLQPSPVDPLPPSALYDWRLPSPSTTHSTPSTTNSSAPATASSHSSLPSSGYQASGSSNGSNAPLNASFQTVQGQALQQGYAHTLQEHSHPHPIHSHSLPHPHQLPSHAHQPSQQHHHGGPQGYGIEEDGSIRTLLIGIGLGEYYLT